MLIRASTNPFVQHLPHFAFVVVGVIAYFWIGYRHRPGDEEPRPAPGMRQRGQTRSRRVGSRPVPTSAVRAAAAVAAASTARAGTAPAVRRVRPSVARRALLALAPLIGAVATGAVLYGLDVGRDRPGTGVIWSHVGFSILALLLVVYKLKALGGTRLRHALRGQRVSDLLSLVLGALLVPLLITGIVLLVAPSTGSFTAYLHLVGSAWWTAMLVWHLWRYMGAAVRSTGAPAVTAPAVTAPPVPVPSSD